MKPFKFLSFFSLILLIASCVESNPELTVLNEDASGAKNNSYWFRSKDANVSFDLTGANFLLVEDCTKNGRRSMLLYITDGGSIKYLSPTGNWTYYIGMRIDYTGIEPDEYWVKESWTHDYSVPTVHYATHDNITKYGGIGWTYTSTIGVESFPGYQPKQEYMRIKGNIAVGEVVTLTFNNVQSIIYAHSSLVPKLLGRSSLRVTGTIVNDQPWPCVTR